MTPTPAIALMSSAAAVSAPTIAAPMAGAPWYAGALAGLTVVVMVTVLCVAFYPFVTRRAARADGRAVVEYIAAQREAAERLGVPLDQLPPPPGPPAVP